MVDLNDSNMVLGEILKYGRIEVVIGDIVNFDTAKSVVEGLKSYFDFPEISNLESKIRVRIGPEEIIIQPDKIVEDAVVEEEIEEKAVTIGTYENSEEKIIELIRDKGTKRKLRSLGECVIISQSDLVKESGYSKSKVSIMLSVLRSNGVISKVRDGKNNVIALNLKKLESMDAEKKAKEEAQEDDFSLADIENEQIKILNSQLEAANKDLVETKTQLSTAKDQISQILKEEEILVGENVQLRNENKKYNEIKAQLIEAIEKAVSASRDKEIYAQKAAGFEQESIRYKEEAENLSREINALKEQLSGKDRDIVDTRSKFDGALQDLSNLRSINNDLGQKLEESHMELKKAQEMIENLSKTEKETIKEDKVAPRKKYHAKGQILSGVKAEMYDKLSELTKGGNAISAMDFRKNHFPNMDPSMFSKYKKILEANGYIEVNGKMMKALEAVNVNTDLEVKNEIGPKNNGHKEPLEGKAKEMYEAIVRSGGQIKQKKLKEELKGFDGSFGFYRKKLIDEGYVVKKKGMLKIKGNGKESVRENNGDETMLEHENQINSEADGMPPNESDNGSDHAIDDEQEKLHRIKEMEHSGETITMESVSKKLEITAEEASELLDKHVETA